MDAGTFGWLSVIPPVLAIGLAIATRQVTVSLVAGIWVGWLIHAGWNPVSGTGAAITAIINVFVDAGHVEVMVSVDDRSIVRRGELRKGGGRTGCDEQR